MNVSTCNRRNKSIKCEELLILFSIIDIWQIKHLHKQTKFSTLALQSWCSLFKLLANDQNMWVEAFCSQHFLGPKNCITLIFFFSFFLLQILVSCRPSTAKLVNLILTGAVSESILHKIGILPYNYDLYARD